MACTTILVGKKASYDGSTMTARNDDGGFTVKKVKIVRPFEQPKKYKSKISHVSIELPDNPLRYTSIPNVNQKHGVWGAMGVNSKNVGMTATETITSNSLVLGADPLVVYEKANGKRKEKIGGIGEEDLLTIVLPYINTAKEGVIRLGSLLEKYGTYESNGIAFSDENEIWWLETIGGHHYIAKRVKDDEYVMMPNQFGLDNFDFKDAYGDQKENMCSKDLKEFLDNNHLDLNKGAFNPRNAFGSHSDADHVYNTPRAWYIGRYFNPNTYKWDGENADYTPLSDNIPWSLKPEKKITVEDVKYILSSYYQGTKYDPYQKANVDTKGIYRPIGTSKTDDMAIIQIRDYVPEEIKAVEWICLASNAFNAPVPVYPNCDKLPKYLCDVKEDVSTNNLYWNSRLIGALCDANYKTSIIHVERYQRAVANKGHQIINEYDKKMIETKNYSLIDEANEKAVKMIQEETQDVLNKVLDDASKHMHNGYNRSDN